MVLYTTVFKILNKSYISYKSKVLFNIIWFLIQSRQIKIQIWVYWFSLPYGLSDDTKILIFFELTSGKNESVNKHWAVDSKVTLQNKELIGKTNKLISNCILCV